MKPIPDKVMVAPGQWIDVKQVDEVDGGALGCYDQRTGELTIKRGQPEAGKHVILFHELLHIAETKLKVAGVIDAYMPEEFIANCAGIMVAILAGSGLWNGLTYEELEDSYPEELQEDSAGNVLDEHGNITEFGPIAEVIGQKLRKENSMVKHHGKPAPPRKPQHKKPPKY